MQRVWKPWQELSIQEVPGGPRKSKKLPRRPARDTQQRRLPQPGPPQFPYTTTRSLKVRSPNTRGWNGSPSSLPIMVAHFLASGLKRSNSVSDVLTKYTCVLSTPPPSPSSRGREEWHLMCCPPPALLCAPVPALRGPLRFHPSMPPPRAQSYRCRWKIFGLFASTSQILAGLPIQPQLSRAWSLGEPRWDDSRRRSSARSSRRRLRRDDRGPQLSEPVVRRAALRGQARAAPASARTSLRPRCARSALEV